MFSFVVETQEHRAIDRGLLLQPSRRGNNPTLHIFFELVQPVYEQLTTQMIVLFEASSSHTEIMGTFPNQWFCLGCSMGCKTILMLDTCYFTILNGQII